MWATEWEMSLREGVHQQKDSEQDVKVSWALNCFPQKNQEKELLQAGPNQRDQLLCADTVHYHKDTVLLFRQVKAKLPQKSSHLLKTSEKDRNILGYPPKSGNACSKSGLSAFSPHYPFELMAPTRGGTDPVNTNSAVSPPLGTIIINWQ